MENDTPKNIDELFDIALKDDIAEESEETPTEPVEEPKEESAEGSEAPNEDSETEESQDTEEKEQPEEVEEESFTDVDPETLDDSDKDAYKRLQADYTKKRQAETSRMKELENKIEELKSEVNPDKKLSDVEKDYLDEKEKLWQTDAIDDINKLEPSLDENSPKFNSEYDTWARARLDAELTQHAKDNNGYGYGFDYKSLLPQLRQEWKAMEETIVTNYLDKQGRARKAKAAKTIKKSPKKVSTSSKEKKINSIDDALDAALEDIGN